jgi:hypothetical protein
MTSPFVELTGLLAQPDRKNRLVLTLVDRLSTPGWDRAPDASHHTLHRVAGPGRDPERPFITPYRLRDRPDSAGIRGDCWVNLETRGRGAKDRQRRVLGLAAELLSQEVRLTVRPKRYSFRDARGATQAGTMLQFVTLERLKPRGAT